MLCLFQGSKSNVRSLPVCVPFFLICFPIILIGADLDSAESVFDLFKSMEGKWIGKSTKGWEEQVTYRVIAGGSVVTGTSFDAHPNETMMTMYYLHEGHLMLTHYCVARNQPRLVATSFNAEERTVTFTYLDATGISSRDQGHMDKAIFRFVDNDHVISRWTWYQNGQERWLEEIRLERLR